MPYRTKQPLVAAGRHEDSGNSTCGGALRQSLEDEKRQTTSLGAELRAASTSIATRPVALSSLSSRDIIQREIEITQSLRQSAKVILEKGPLFVEKIDRLSGRLQSAPECYLVAARLFRKFADEESLRRDCGALSPGSGPVRKAGGTATAAMVPRYASNTIEPQSWNY